MLIIISFICFLLGFVAIGLLSVRYSQKTGADYLLANQDVKPWLVALSGAATNNSGYMFVGYIGFIYVAGLHGLWIMIGWIFGDYLASLFVHRRLRVATEETETHSFAGVLSKWNGTDFRKLRALGGLLTVAFLGTYAAAQLAAGSKALHVLFGWDYAAGAVIGAVIVLLYCFAGGIRASIWTDAAQSFVMIFSIALLCVVAVVSAGGFGNFVQDIESISPSYMDLFPSDLALGGFTGLALFVAGWTFAGVGVIGQPHIMVRFMAMREAADIGRVRLYYYGWNILFTIFCTVAGLSARLFLPDVEGFDVELALPTLAAHLLPEIFVGLILAGLFAATMSTADSQILSCTAAVSRDFGFKKLRHYWATKGATIFVTIMALIIALYGDDSVFSLVVLAWSILGAAFAPLLIVYAFGQKPSEILAIVMMFCGPIVVLVWRETGLTNYMAEFGPGILGGLIVFYVGKVLGYAQANTRA